MAATAALALPDLSPWRAGNTGIPFVTTLRGDAPGPHVVICALIHGNEICGALALDRLLREGLRPARGRLTLAFCNVAAYDRLEHGDAAASRCVDEDMNRLWEPAILDGKGTSIELERARELRPAFDAADYLLDLHSMLTGETPLLLSGMTDKSLALARKVGSPALIVRDQGHAAGPRLRDYGAFADPRSAKTALLVECGQHRAPASAAVAYDTSLRFLAASGVIDRAFSPAPQRVIEVTEAVTVTEGDFRFLGDWRGLEVIGKAGTPIARDGGREIKTPYDNCVLIMPSRRIAPGQTAVRLGRYV